MTEVIDGNVVAEVGEMAGGEIVTVSKGVDWQKYAKTAAIVAGVVGLGALGYASYQYFWGEDPEDDDDEDDDDEVEAAPAPRKRNRNHGKKRNLSDENVRLANALPKRNRSKRSKRKQEAAPARITAETQPEE